MQRLLSLHASVRWMMTSLPPGRPILQVRHAINTHKALCAPVVLACMASTDRWTTGAWLMLALYGTYGALWLHKDRTFPDRSWDAAATPGSFLALNFLLAHFWVTPLLLTMGPDPAGPVMALAVALWGAGMYLLHGADVQKHFVLAERPGLITDGFFARVRNPNYLGEMLIYSSFATMASASPHPLLPWALNAWVWGIVFLPAFVAKDASLSRHVGWTTWADQTGWILPRVAGSPVPGVVSEAVEVTLEVPSDPSIFRSDRPIAASNRPDDAPARGRARGDDRLVS